MAQRSSPAGVTPLEDAFAYAKFAREALGTEDMDFRARPSSTRRPRSCAPTSSDGFPTPPMPTVAVSYADLEAAGTVVLVAFEPEEESPIIFLRLRKAARKDGLKVVSVAPFTTPSVVKTFGSLVRCPPGDEPAALDGLSFPTARSCWWGSVSRASPVASRRWPDWSSAAGARVAWVPRRAGERGALEAGLLPEPECS